MVRPFGLGTLALLVVLAGCARPQAPVGGDVPETPLRVTESRPGALEVVSPFDRSVEIRFQRRVSERPTEGTLRDGVVVSPRTGSVEVRHRRNGIDVSMEGGFMEETVYRVTVLPRFQDLFQNRMAEAYDLFFSTGPELEPNILGGVVSDRLTLQEVRQARVDAVPADGGPVHSTVTDSTGIFTFPHIPSGEYRVIAYEDQNRNREPDFEERQDSIEVAIARGDTAIVTDLALLRPDTTAAVAEEFSVLDSLSIGITFDDYLDPEAPLDGIQVEVVGEEGESLPVSEALHVHVWEAARAAAMPPEDAPVPDDSPDADLPDPDEPEAAVPDPDSPGVEPDPAAPADDDGPILPDRRIVVVLSSPMQPGATYAVEVSEVRNINGIPGGGGSGEVEGPEPPPPDDPEPADPDPDDPEPADPDPGDLDPDDPEPDDLGPAEPDSAVDPDAS